MILQTNLKHIADSNEYSEVINNKEYVMVCCGRMGPMCIPVYSAMKELETEYPNVEFRDMLFDNPHATVIRNLPEARSFMGLPFVIYYKNGEVVRATSSIQNKDQIKGILDDVFANGESN